MRWRGFRHPSPDSTDLRLHKPVRDCWTDWIPRTGASDAELVKALLRIEGTRNAIGASPVIAQQYADECSAFLHLHHEALIAHLSTAPSEGSAPINYQSADSRLIVGASTGQVPEGVASRAIHLLVAGGYVARAKADEALNIIGEAMRAAPPASSQGDSP